MIENLIEMHKDYVFIISNQRNDFYPGILNHSSLIKNVKIPQNIWTHIKNLGHIAPGFCVM